MAREADYQVLYRAAADFSALTREATKAKAILKAMREEEEKANKAVLQDQDRIEKARTRARKALEAQNMAATVSARISREMSERGKKEAETARDLARGSEVAARQINKLAEAYKKLNAAASGESTSSSAKTIGARSSFTGVTLAELKKAQEGLTGYLKAAREGSDTNTKLGNSFKVIKANSSEVADILSRLSSKTRDMKDSVTEVTVSTKNYGNIVETTTRRVTNAGTEAEKIATTIRRVTKEQDASSRGFAGWAVSLLSNMGKVWREADQGVSAFGRLRRAFSDSKREGGTLNVVSDGLNRLGNVASKAVGFLARLPRALQLAIGIATIFEPAVAVLGALGAAALGAANNLVSLGGALAALPGLIAAASTSVAALWIAFAPVKGVLEQFKRARQESDDAATKSSKAQTDNSSAIRAAASGVRSAMNSVKSAQEGVIDANRKLGSANQNLIESNKELKRAQEDVGAAARDAKRDLEDLRDEVNDGAMSQEGAEIALARAKENLLRVNRDLNSSNLDRREAALAVKEAEDALRDTRRDNQRSKQDLDEAEKKGIKGSDLVVAANERVADAHQNVIDAQQQVADSQRGLAAAHRRVADAELDLADARMRLAESAKGQASSTAAATTQQDRYKKMLSQLGPETRKVVEGILDLESAWKGIQKDTGESFFKRISGDFGLIKGLLPVVNDLLTKSADALGEVAHKGLLMLSSGPWKADFRTLATDNAVLIRNMGDAGLSVADAFRNITMAAGPFTKWVTLALKEGAANFAKWSADARKDGSIARFLEDTKSRMQQMWQITKNVLATLNSWNTSSNDFGRWTLDRLEAMTKRWREVAKAQEEAGSPLKKYLEDVRPLLSAIGSLLGAVVAGFAAITSDPENMASTIKLLQTLEQNVLPPLLRLLDELNDSGIAITVAEALGTIFDAFADFLDVGGGEAITVFLTSFAAVVDLFLTIASLPVVGTILASIASSIALVAGAVVAAKFLGLFKLVELFKWVRDNGKKVANNFRDIGDGINSTTTTTGGGSSPAGSPAAGGGTSRATKASVISATEIAAVQQNIKDYTKATESATTKTGFFSRAMGGVSSAAGGMRRGLGSMVDFLGGPWGAALAVATIGLTYFYTQQDKIAGKASEYKSALEGFGQGADGAADGVARLNEESLKANPKLVEMVTQLEGLGLSAEQIENAFNGSGTAVEDAIKQIDAAIEKAELNKQDYFLGDFIGDNTFNKGTVEKIDKLKALRQELVDNKITHEEYERAVERLGLKQQVAATSTQVLADKQHAANFQASAAREAFASMEGVLKVLGDSSATTAQRFDALKTATELLYGDQISATESSENFNRKLLELEQSVKTNGKSLSEHSLEGLNNRDALEAAAGAIQNETLMLIASGVPYADAIKKHKERTDKLKEEAGETGLNVDKAGALIDQYSKIPPAKVTDVKLEGFDAVYQHLRELQFAQWALKYGLSPEEAAAAWKRQEALRKGEWQNPKDNADKQKFAGGGAVFGPGSKTSDDIDAKLSNGEFVTKAASVDYYGTDLLYALNHKMIDRNVLRAAQHMNSVKGTKTQLDPMYANGGPVQGFADGGKVWPFPVSLGGVAGQTQKIYNKWKSGFSEAEGGGGGSIGGWKHMWNWVKSRFPYAHLASAYRPGDPLYHGKGKAIDVTVPDKFGTGRWWDVFRAIKGTFFQNIAELIWDFAGNKAVKNGQNHFFRGAKAGPGSHADHIHWAMRNPAMAYKPARDNADSLKFAGGGLASLMNFGGLSMPSVASVPQTNISGLSSAAKSVVNNTSGGMSIGAININNPVPERGGDSIRKSVMRTAMLFDEP